MSCDVIPVKGLFSPEYEEYFEGCHNAEVCSGGNKRVVKGKNIPKEDTKAKRRL
jgi:hypothetical protein